MSLRRTISYGGASNAQLASPSTLSRKRKQCKLASQLKRPSSNNSNASTAITSQIHSNKRMCMTAMNNSIISPSVISRDSLSVLSKGMSSPSMTQSKSTPFSVPALPQKLRGNESFSVERLSNIKPLNFVQSCLKAYKIKPEECDSLSKKNFFLEITEDSLAAYQADVIQAIREEDIEALRRIKNSGRSLQGCNRYGESLMHIACRRGSPEVLSFLINEGECSLRVIDDYGRTPLHDACWQAEPNFELIDIVLDAEPDLLMLRDRRGFVALEYVRREHWGVWIQYLSFRMKREIRRKLTV
jgi:hypothetical protein